MINLIGNNFEESYLDRFKELKNKKNSNFYIVDN